MSSRKASNRKDIGFAFDGIDDEVLRQERARARELRKTGWWQNKIARGECHYCQQVFPPAQLTMDHLVPLSRGGQSTKANLVPACKTCNTKKKTLMPLEWDEYMARLDKQK